ncbi:3-hydroxybutyryl-CoA dehydrogenase [Paraglaciecola mesophila]|uniref:3-hydroxybutyryl-CoA dehydrogenase n=1 Tax=Paraglaciecola mesophila TaxID=197222 RepID=A0A857JH88_9ALTE|nr:3-hydroxyacyl-CoA dehydrogenase NAD-binding domain-containing protein [Paraglaciecola mesophila]QHJ11365.1 3-hydroxybutyryl-CoA dehydrogenase [Paraglaciecola mesophila]
MKNQNAEQVKSVAVIGAGIMGEGIAQGFAQAGIQVSVFDNNHEALTKCKQNIANNIDAFIDYELVSESKETITARIEYYLVSNLAQDLASVDYVIEVLPEILPLKRDLFQQIDNLPDNIIFATNTSSMTVSSIGQEMKSAHRLIGLHYFNPAHIIPAVEIHTGSETSTDTIELTQALMSKIGKKPVLVRKEIPGFIINRLTGAMEREIDYLLEQGVVSPEDLDIAVKASYGFRLACLGPMEAEDMIGLDTAARASANIFPTLSNALVPSEQLLEKVNKGETGIKSGTGWYRYPDDQKAQKVANNNQRLLRQLQLFQQQN